MARLPSRSVWRYAVVACALTCPAATACTNDYGAFRYPRTRPADGGAGDVTAQSADPDARARDGGDAGFSAADAESG